MSDCMRLVSSAVSGIPGVDEDDFLYISATGNSVIGSRRGVYDKWEKDRYTVYRKAS